VAGMEARGHVCVLFLYDRHGGDLQRHAGVIHENWPGIHAEIRDATEGISSVDAAVASSWETAHVLASRSTAPIPRLYFIQDFEPFFYPRGSVQALAEDSYRFGFVNIALGDMVAHELHRLDLDCVIAPFGCDTATYNLTRTEARSGVVFYAKRAADRRGYLLGKLALEEFHARHPEQPIHLCGDPVDDWPIPTIQHHRLSPAELNDLYNRTVAGLAMSFTNISLVAEEMLAAGTIPIVNDSSYSRADLPNENVEWARPTAGGIADALCRVVEDPHGATRSIDASQSVRDGWGPAQEIVAATIARAVASAHARGESSAARWH
jgi:O-antigen biosynthesis protein